ncbi:MAG: isoleucine--tRNA ligase [Phycisphaeraceae bacterium]|nr:isoleucine--tRNA ligase [Phycisphaeraceae bacterium]
MSQSTPTPPSTPPASPAAGSDEGKNRYRGTLNLPRTSFAMKANLVQSEPESLKRWQAMGLYRRLREARSGGEPFVFHDGPPYANGDIHLGHLMNKCLKDLVVRTRTMSGRDTPYVPGWDCHGLPIEHKVMTEMVAKGKASKLATLPEDQRRMVIRRECRAYAEKYVKLQSGQMQRLLTLADYDHPYLTMNPGFEAATLDVLAGLVEQGLVYRALKPVHWSIANETALAEAELEYEDREDPSIYVDFEAADADAVYDAFDLPPADDGEDGDDEGEEDERDAGAGAEEGAGAGEEGKTPRPGARPGQRPCFMIWTTTPWTLPANLAIAVNTRFEYALTWIDGNITVLAAEAVKRVCEAARAEKWVILATTPGDRLVGLTYRHPFVDMTKGQGAAGLPGADLSGVFRVVAAEYVTLEDGTGLVHTAPGHGTEDYATGLREGLPVYCPVKGDGSYDGTTAPWLRGVDIWKANDLVLDHLRASGHLFHHHRFTHSYPHDWRSKTPVIFRCTEQWFVGVDRPTIRERVTLRDLAQRAVESAETSLSGEGAKVGFVPEWGRNRMRGMLESRPDWCISRQRAWGLPIPAFFTPAGDVLMTAASIRAVARIVREQGSDAWFTGEPAALLAGYDPAGDPDPTVPRSLREGSAGGPEAWAANLRKGPDILDVWFESGSTWKAVLHEPSGGRAYPADLYLEGSDQHRGWFQSSLLTALGTTGAPPYRTVLTHGFMNDKDGRKLSKSRPDAKDYEVENLTKAHGVDVLRWWVASLAYENDVKVDKEFFTTAGESYRKVRNTIRFLLSNLDDFTAAGHHADPSSDGRILFKEFPPTSIDAWVLGEYNTLAAAVLEAYERFDFRAAQQRLYDFCNDTLSAVYLAAVKDRLYCDAAGSVRRRRTQTAIHDLADGLCRLLAPILCHTADEAFRSLRKVPVDDARTSIHLEMFIPRFDIHADPRWKNVMEARVLALQAIEQARRERGIDNPLDMGVTIPDSSGSLAGFDPTDLADLLGVSRVAVAATSCAYEVEDLRSHPRCERSWKRDGTVKLRSDGGLLSDRDAAAVNLA